MLIKDNRKLRSILFLQINHSHECLPVLLPQFIHRVTNLFTLNRILLLRRCRNSLKLFNIMFGSNEEPLKEFDLLPLVDQLRVIFWSVTASHNLVKWKVTSQLDHLGFSTSKLVSESLTIGCVVLNLEEQILVLVAKGHILEFQRLIGLTKLFNINLLKGRSFLWEGV